MTEEQLNYSKQLFAEGEKAMKQKDFATALLKYQEAYRYAPHLHLFTYNIAVAAEAAGDCKSAHYYFGLFLSRVPEHPERKRVTKKVETLQETCPYDHETSEVVSSEEREERDEERALEEEHRAMNDALRELQTAEQLYGSAGTRFGNIKAFSRAAKRKGRHARRLAKLADKHGVPSQDGTPESATVPDNPQKACRVARAQEKRTIEALEKVLDYYDTREAYRVVNRFLRAADRRDLPAFEDCAR